MLDSMSHPFTSLFFGRQICQPPGPFHGPLPLEDQRANNNPMPRPQFTLRSLLVAMLVVAAFLGGMAVQEGIEAGRRAGRGSRIAVPVTKTMPSGETSSYVEEHWSDGTVTIRQSEAQE